MLRMMRQRRLGHRGILLISSYLVLSLFLIYSSAMTLRTNTQRMVSDRLRDRYQAMDLVQGSLEQLRDDLYEFFRVKVYHDRYGGNALATMAWLDTLDPAAGLTPDPALAFAAVTGASGTGTTASPRQIALPSGAGQASVVKVTNTGGVASPRDVTIEATATVGGVTKRIRATYRFALATSDIFRYAYFVNNYGWFDIVNGWMQIDGEVRSNGDVRFSGSTGSRMWLDGDIFASQNAELVNPTDPFGAPVQGLIYGDPSQDSLSGWYFPSKKARARPERRKSFAGQPTIGGGSTEYLPYGQGWDTDRPGLPDPNQPDQQRFERQSTQDIPYLGDLMVYKTLAQEHNGGAGSTLTFATPGADGVYGNADDVKATVNAVNLGTKPLVIVGTSQFPIKIDGPVVVEGDVIIKGVVVGQGTIYAGRNVHVVGDIWYKSPPEWPSLWRDTQTGQINASSYGDLGSVCNSGTYVPNTVPVGSRCP